MSLDAAGDRLPHPKKIDVAIIGLVMSMLVQAAGFIWFWSELNSRVVALEREVAPLRAMAEAMSRLDERTKALDRIERKLDSLEPVR